jgi:hypothetical protein
MAVRNLAKLDASASTWKKSSYSGGEGGNCVEVATNQPGTITLRDSKNPHGPTLVFTRTEWTTFLQALKQDQLI